jgi:phage portal protein BeeE
MGRYSYLSSLRSMAPGQWTDNRREQANHLTGAVYVAIKVLADQASACDVECYRLTPDAKEGKGTEEKQILPFHHPICSLIRRPNPKETGGMLRRRLVQQLCLTGTALMWRLDNGLGVPSELWNVPTGVTQPVPRGINYPEGAYRVQPYFSMGPFAMYPGLMSAGGCIIPGEEMLRVDFPHPLIQYDAYSPLTACNLQLDAIEAIDRSRWYAMQQGINPSAIIEMDPSVIFPDQSELDRLKEEFAAKYSGPHNSGRVAVLGPGASLKAWSQPPKDMGWESSWGQLTDFVLSVFGVTKSLAFMSEESSYAALYAALKQFNLFSLCPLLDLISDVINVQLVWRFWGEDYCVRLVPRKIDDDDLQERRLSTDIGIGLRTINEIRTLRGLEPVEWGEVRAMPGSMSSSDEDGSMMDTDPSNDDPAPEEGSVSPGKEGAAQKQQRPQAGLEGAGIPRKLLERMNAAATNGNGNGKAH